MRTQFFICLAPVFTVVLFFGSSVSAAVFWDEGVNGDLSNNQSSPNQFTLENGVNTLIGSVGLSSGSQDWFTLTVPQDFQFNSIIPRAFTSSDQIAFIGFQSGNSFVGNAGDAASYMGYGHFGPGSFPPQPVNSEMMPGMSTAPGAQGFTPPLGPGSYTFLIQQLGSETGYRFDFTAIPEVRGQVLIAVLCAAYFLKRRWPKKFAKSARA